MSSVSLSVSVTLVDQDHIGWKLIARTISSTPSLFVAHLLPGEHGEIWRLGGKGGVLGHRSSNISEMRKDRGKVTMESL